MRRFFFEPTSRDGDQVILDGDESRHITKVLRMRAGESLELLDGQGRIYSAIVVSTGKMVTAAITGEVETTQPPQRPLVVCQGYLKGNKMDGVLQRCTELGVVELLPFWSSRCQGSLRDLRRSTGRQERFQRIVAAACKQSRRPEPMVVEEPQTYTDCLALLRSRGIRHGCLLFEDANDLSLHDLRLPPEAETTALIIGPEGGFTAAEVLLAQHDGWPVLSLGTRILRAETATLAAVAILQYRLHNI